MYPDSVSLVRPPKTTMPKTLAALPRSQYATIFSLKSGKYLFRSLAALILWLREDRGDDSPDLGSSEATAVAYHLGVKVAFAVFGRAWARRHRQRQHVNNLCESLGAGLARAGHVRDTEAMFTVIAESFLENIILHVLYGSPLDPPPACHLPMPTEPYFRGSTSTHSFTTSPKMMRSVYLAQISVFEVDTQLLSFSKMLYLQP